MQASRTAEYDPIQMQDRIRLCVVSNAAVVLGVLSNAEATHVGHVACQLLHPALHATALT